MPKRKPSKFDSSPAGAAYRNEWIRQNCDKYNFAMPKGRKQQIADAAAAEGKSMSQFILAAIDEHMARNHATDDKNDDK